MRGFILEGEEIEGLGCVDLCIHVHSKYYCKWVKNFPGTVLSRRFLKILTHLEQYLLWTFLESARQGAADEKMKTPKS